MGKSKNSILGQYTLKQAERIEGVFKKSKDDKIVFDKKSITHIEADRQNAGFSQDGKYCVESKSKKAEK